MTISIRALCEGDLETADAVLSSAFQRAGSWIYELRLFIKLQPDGIFIATQGGVAAGMVAAISYANYAYVGLMGVHQQFQKQGLGQALMEHVLSWTSQHKVSLVKLDASKAGQPLYEKLGFVALDEVYVFERRMGNPGVRPPMGIQPMTFQPMTFQHLDLIAAYDSPVFGADRSLLLDVLLENHPGRAFFLQDDLGQVKGFLFAQSKRIGPWISRENDAEALLQMALSLPFNETVSVITPAKNAGAFSLLQGYGFRVDRVNRHMAYGEGEISGQRDKIYGQTSLSFG